MKTLWQQIFQYTLGAIIVIGFFIILVTVFSKEMPVSNKEIGLLVIGALIAKFGDVVSYFYGSSKGSSDKNELLNKN